MLEIKKEEQGFTLVELIVVLALLSIFATMALTATSGITEQTRYEETIRTFDKLELAIFGDPHGNGPAYGFVSDIGRFPTLNTQEPTNLIELFKQGNLPDFKYHTSGKIQAGWNGPYIHPPDNEDSVTEVKDGWGNGIAFSYDPSGKYYEIRSYGADGKPFTTDDLRRKFQEESFLYGTVYFDIKNNYHSAVTVEIVLYQPTDSVTGISLTYFDIGGTSSFTIPSGSSMSNQYGEVGDLKFDLNQGLTAGFRSIKVIVPNLLNPIQIVRVVGGGTTKVHFTVN
jgi:prepilin-type N-terminal cleavage/methylation domain-containing protein